jgi:SAM-dependent methyltransferase
MSQLLILLLLLAVAAAFAIGGLMGAPYVPILRRDSRPLLDLSGLKAGDTLVDLGSGDGQLLRAAAARGIRCIGYEINPIMAFISRLVTWRYRRLVTIHVANLWDINLPPADVIYVFLMPKFMDRLGTKLQAEITRPSRVISYVFEIPTFKPTRRGANAYLYDLMPATPAQVARTNPKL